MLITQLYSWSIQDGQLHETNVFLKFSVPFWLWQCLLVEKSVALATFIRQYSLSFNCVRKIIW